jgi:NDP-sugar pyrophosphorylase family protein
MTYNQLETAVILAGGAGLRLRPLTEDMPKAMIIIAGKPLLQWIIEWLKFNGISNIVVGVAYKNEKIIDYFGSGKDFGVKIKYSVHTVEGGTSEGFRLAIERHVKDNVFLGINGDELVRIKTKEFLESHVANGGIVTLAVSHYRSPFGVVEVDGTDILRFQEKPILRTHYVSVGTYIFSRQVLDYIPRSGDIESTLFPRLASMRKLKAYVYDGFWATINTLKDLDEVESLLRTVS